MTNTSVPKRKTKLPWGVELELESGRCIYMGAKDVIASGNEIEIVVNETNSISLPRKAVRRILIMVSQDERKETGDGSAS